MQSSAPHSRLGFYPRYAALTLALLLTEIAIALFMHDRFIRPFVGDVLVVMLIFAFCRTFVAMNHVRLALGVLVFAFAIEIGQYFELATKLGLQHNRVARTVIGMTFDVHDLLAYSVGIAVVIVTDLSLRRRSGTH